MENKSKRLGSGEKPVTPACVARVWHGCGTGLRPVRTRVRDPRHTIRLVPYNSLMDELDFRRKADAALESLKRSLITAEEQADFEVEDQSGALHISFEEPPGRFVVSPNAPVRQIWISALSTSFKLDWSEAKNDFVLEKTGEGLKPLLQRLVNQQLGEEAVNLK